MPMAACQAAEEWAEWICKDARGLFGGFAASQEASDVVPTQRVWSFCEPRTPFHPRARSDCRGLWSSMGTVTYRPASAESISLDMNILTSSQSLALLLQRNLSQTLMAVRRRVAMRGWLVKARPEVKAPEAFTTGHQNDARQRIRSRINARQLPRGPGRATYGLRCSGKICDACAGPIFPYQTQYLLEFGPLLFPTERLRMHRVCFLIWREYTQTPVVEGKALCTAQALG